MTQRAVSVRLPAGPQAPHERGRARHVSGGAGLATAQPGLEDAGEPGRLGPLPGGTAVADNDGMNRAARLVAIAAAVVTAGCTAGAPPAAAPSARPSAASSPAHRAVPVSCPVTRPLPHRSPPPGLHAIDNFTYYLHGWYGNTALWVGVPVDGVLPAGRPYGTPWAGSKWGTKFPWWPVIPGHLTITARRLDGPSAGFRGRVTGPAGIGKARFIPSGLYWPAPGCWQVTGTISDHSLTFVAWVKTLPSSAG